MTDEKLQFDRAEFAEKNPGAGAACTACRRPLGADYYEVNGQVTCPACKTSMATVTGTPGGRFLRAAGLGVLAGAVGSGIWYAVAAMGYELGIIAIAVGFMVGTAVFKGSNGRGGWRYQALAMVLTYASIVSTHVPAIVSGLSRTEAKASPMVFWVTVAVIAVAAPFLGGIKNLIGIAIIGIALYEAWKINQRRSLQISGPFRVAAAGAGPIPAAVD
jgi:hypothetical protein